MRIHILLLAAAAFASSPGAYADGSADGGRSTVRGRSVVQYGDLDLATEQGAKMVLARIERAATKACGGQPTFSTYTGALEGTFRACRVEAVARAVKKLGAPTVTRLYSQTRPRAS